MQSVSLAHEVDLDGWRNAARRLALAGIPPTDVLWSVGAPNDLFAETPRQSVAAPANPDGTFPQDTFPRDTFPRDTFKVGRALVDLAGTVIQAREPERFALLYGLIWRAHRGERHLATAITDPAVQRATRLAQMVRRDTHKMRAFLRFRVVAPVGDETQPRHVAWFEPDNYILEANSGFFVRRFATMVFSILTPYRSFHWTGTDEHFSPGATRADIPDDDALERYWRAYYSAIFNPARLKIGAMRSEMPKKYWHNLPEAAVIPALIRSAASRTDAMVARSLVGQPEIALMHHADTPVPGTTAVASVPNDAATIEELAKAASACQACNLWSHATQTVFGEGPSDAAMMMIGEQPGDQEDLASRPFVGPAGQLLDRAVQQAGLDRSRIYITNAVKHFKFEPRGKRRIHQKPDPSEIAACHMWIEAERRLIKPAVTVLLGATAARSILGRAITISRERGRPIADGEGGQILVTVHPSYLLRLPDERAKIEQYAAFVADLRLAHSLL